MHTLRCIQESPVQQMARLRIICAKFYATFRMQHFVYGIAAARNLHGNVVEKD